MITIQLSESVLHTFLAQIELYGNNESHKFIEQIIAQCAASGYQIDEADILTTQHILIGEKIAPSDLKPWMSEVMK